MEMETTAYLTPDARHEMSEIIIGWLREHPLSWTAGEIKAYAASSWPDAPIVDDLLEELNQDGTILRGVMRERLTGADEKTYLAEVTKKSLSAVPAPYAREMLHILAGRNEQRVVIGGVPGLIDDKVRRVVRVYYTERKSSPGWRHCRYFIVIDGQLKDITRTIANMFHYPITNIGRLRLQLGAAHSAENTVHAMGTWLRTFAPYANALVIPEKYRMAVRLDPSLVRRIPLDGTFVMRYVPYSPDVGILFREDADSGCFVESDGSKGWKTKVVGDALVRVLDHPSVALDSHGVLCGRNRVVERDLSTHTFSLGVCKHYVRSFGGRWWREGEVIVVANEANEIVWAKHLSEDEWNSVSATFPPPTSPTPNS